MIPFLGTAEAPRDSELYAAKEAGKRFSESMNLHVIAGLNYGRWIAVRLADGWCDPTVYDTRDDAARHQADERWFWYEQIKPVSYSPDECALTLMFARAAYDSGWRNGPGTPAPILPSRLEVMYGKTRRLRRHARSH